MKMGKVKKITKQNQARKAKKYKTLQRNIKAMVIDSTSLQLSRGFIVMVTISVHLRWLKMNV